MKGKAVDARFLIDPYSKGCVAQFCKFNECTPLIEEIFCAIIYAFPTNA